MRKKRALDIDDFSDCKDKNGSNYLMHGSHIIARNVRNGSVVLFWETRILAGLYDIPVCGNQKECDDPIHFFVYVVDQKRTYRFKKRGVVLSSVYSIPICYQDNELLKLNIKKDTVSWEKIREVGFYQNVFITPFGRLGVESFMRGPDFRMPMYLDENLGLKPYKDPETRRYLWKYIYYGLSGGTFQSSMMANLMIPSKDTLDELKGFIYTVEFAIEKCIASNVMEGEDYALDSEDGIKNRLDLVLKGLEKEVEWKDKIRSLDIDDVPLIGEILENYSSYAFVKKEKLYDLKAFCEILETVLRGGPERRLTFLLLRIIFISKIMQQFGECSFPSGVLNSFLQNSIKRVKDTDYFIYEICRSWNNEIDVKEFEEELKSRIENDKSGAVFSYDELYSIHVRQSSEQPIDERSACNRIGWIGETQGEGKVLYVQPVSFGELINESEVHPEMDEEGVRAENSENTRIAEVYYDVVNNHFCLVNRDRIPLEILVRTMNELEGGYVEAVFLDDADNNNETIGNHGNHALTVNLKNDDLDVSCLNSEGKKFVGYASVKDGTLSILRYSTDELTSNEYANDGYEPTDWDYRIRLDTKGKKHIIESVVPDYRVIKVIVDVFGIKQWRCILPPSREKS